MFKRINELSTNAFVRASSLTDKAAPLIGYRPKTRRDKILYVMGFALTISVFSVVTYAQTGGGAAGMAQAAGTQADTIKALLGKFFTFIGILAVAGGFFNMIRKGKEGDNSNIKGSHIFVPILGGALLGTAGVIMFKAAQTVGLQDGDMGNSSATGG